MLVPIRCFTCGYPIGDIAEIFRHIRIERVRAHIQATSETPMQAIIDNYSEINMRDVTDSLGIVASCCRTHLITAQDFRDYY